MSKRGIASSIDASGPAGQPGRTQRALTGPDRELPAVVDPGRLVLDIALVVLFLVLVFLLGLFPLADTDFWWHLRTGDLIRETGQVPRQDPYLFGGAAEKPWIDLHWIFQVLLSVGYQAGGVPMLTVCKSAITTLAVGLLLLARPRSWPVWVMVLAWLPPLFLLAGRMYIRPETLTLLYMSIFMCMIMNWTRHPGLALLLPVVQVLWVNTQGLFVIGPALYVFGVIDAALRRDARAAERGWWKRVLAVGLVLAAACLINPYGLRGALFPIELLNTMRNPLFESIGELMPLNTFIGKAGWQNNPLRLHVGCLVLGVASFLVPLSWKIYAGSAEMAAAVFNPVKKPSQRARRKSTVLEVVSPSARWELRPFRLILFATFAALSWKATRNSHQFAAVAGAVSAWNLGEWAAVMASRRSNRLGNPGVCEPWQEPRWFALIGLAAALHWVGTGGFYAWMGEGRTIGLGERPLWFPHAAARIARNAGMPSRFVCIHNGHSAVWIYHNGPDRKTFADARLEVIGADLYAEYRELERQFFENRGWEERLAELGQPGLLFDLTQPEFSGLTANLLANPRWRCVYFDSIASVFVRLDYPASRRSVDFLQRHFEPDDATDPSDSLALVTAARIARDLSAQLSAPVATSNEVITRPAQPSLARVQNLIGHGYAHRALAFEAIAGEAWKHLGMLEQQRINVPRQRLLDRANSAFDPLLDLPIVRATYAFLRARERQPGDFTTAISLAELYQARGMEHPALPILESIMALTPRNTTQAQIQQTIAEQLPALRARQQDRTIPAYRNQSELDAALTQLRRAGRYADMAELLERAWADTGRGWELGDRLATLYLHLGRTENARETWEGAQNVPRPGLQRSRVAFTHLVEENYDRARAQFEAALEHEPTLFEALYGLSVLEVDAGRRMAAREAIERARRHAPGPQAVRRLDELSALTGVGEREQTQRAGTP